MGQLRTAVNRWLTVTVLVATGLVAAPGGPASAAGQPGEVEDFLRAHPDAVRISADQVAWQGGDVVMTFPASPDGRAAAAAGGCDSGWSCLYASSGYAGRRLQFRSCGYTQSLGAYGFANTASSWINNRGSWTRVYDGGSILWTEYGYARVSYVGSSLNDRADSINLAC